MKQIGGVIFMGEIILLTGPPRVGKTTALKHIIDTINFDDCVGFFTEEIRDETDRIGFKCVSLDGREAILADVKHDSPVRLGRYGLNLQAFEQIAIEVINSAIKDRKILIIDEIGPMQLYSHKFQEVFLDALDRAELIIGTIFYGLHPITDQIKLKENVQLFALSNDKRDRVLAECTKTVHQLLMNK